MEAADPTVLTPVKQATQSRARSRCRKGNEETTGEGGALNQLQPGLNLSQTNLTSEECSPKKGLAYVSPVHPFKLKWKYWNEIWMVSVTKQIIIIECQIYLLNKSIILFVLLSLSRSVPCISNSTSQIFRHCHDQNKSHNHEYYITHY